jgi:hypothetical protein
MTGSAGSRPSSQVVEGPLQEGRAGVGALVGVLLDVGVAAVVVDGQVQKDLADAVVEVRSGHAAAGAVAGTSRARQAGGVDVDERARARPPVAARQRPRRARASRAAVAVEHLPDRRAGSPAEMGQAPGAEVGLGPGVKDRRPLGRRQPPR